MNKQAIAWLKAAVVYFVIGVSLGIYMGASHDHTLKPVHAHINLLGWASMALIGFYVLHFGDRLNARLERIQFWLHQVGAVILLITLTLVMLGNTAIEPVLGITSIVVGVSVLLFAVNVWRSLR
ncbi:hypothetical protein [Hydrogenophaga sp. OTU3427]|uniref:hypothetical protein n=1 Tax=Hydrogenophaga sp. OTU3427 TaxID=3043856 RepID=UPI00313E6725